jgi:hypothetical protein
MAQWLREIVEPRKIYYLDNGTDPWEVAILSDNRSGVVHPAKSPTNLADYLWLLSFEYAKMKPIPGVAFKKRTARCGSFDMSHLLPDQAPLSIYV